MATNLEQELDSAGLNMTRLQIIHGQGTESAHALCAPGHGQLGGRSNMKAPLKEALALEYGARKTPVISAKGQDDLAQKIIEEALKHGVYVAQDPQLLALLSRVDLDAEIPPEMYTAVAVILSWVYWLKGMRPGDEKKTS
jgi:flagellar biosynthesis protein